MDRRLSPFSGKVALNSLRGQVDAPGWTDGEAAAIATPLADLCASPMGARDRQLVLGDAVTIVERRSDAVFVRSNKDGYCGWVDVRCVGAPVAPTHWVAAPMSHIYERPKVQAHERHALPMGARLAVLDVQNGFAETPHGFVPMVHLRAVGDWLSDPVSVAEQFLNVPYLWGGNSFCGLDCSGLVQVSWHACGLECPGDSDLQQALGDAIAEDETPRRGDLIFWKGHVAQVVDAHRLIHANGHSMSVRYEDIDPCIARIIAQGGGPVTARRRP